MSTQTKIPWGYGWCAISVLPPLDTGSFPITRYAFEVDHNSFPEPIEVKTEFPNVYNNIKKRVRGYHVRFNLRLRENSALTSTTGYTDSGAICGFYNDYFRNSNASNTIILQIRVDDSANWAYVNNVSVFHCLVESITINNIMEDGVRFGQELNLVCQTQNMIPKNEFGIQYRDTSTGNFGLQGVITMGAADEDSIYFTT